MVRTEDGVVVKRLGKDNDGGWLLVSDAGPPEWPVGAWPDGAELIGEVRWVGRELP